MCSFAAAGDPHNYNFAMQKYLLLQEQHAELSTHLQQMRPRQPSSLGGGSLSAAASTTASDSSSSPSLLPYHYNNSSSEDLFAAAPSTSASVSCSFPSHGRDATRSSPPRKRCRARRCSGSGNGTLDTIPDEETMRAISTEEQRLFDVNESIKRALTEMLNCDMVRRDSSIRMWTQTRLMETEKELRSGRRRRSSPSRE